MAKRKFKKFTAAERKALKLDQVPETMYDLRSSNEKPPKYPEYERVKPKPIDEEIV